jgi:hypothetical protein
MKIKRSKWFFILLLLYSVKGVSQNVIISPEIIDEPGHDYAKVIGYTPEGYFVQLSNLSLESSRDKVGFKHRRSRLTFFDKELNKAWSKELNSDRVNAHVTAVTFVKGKILILYSVQNTSEESISIFYQWINDNGEIEEGDSPLITFQLSRLNFEKPKIVLSTSRKLLSVILHEYRDKYSQALHVGVLTDDLKLMSQKTFVIPFSDKQYLNSGFALSELGDFAIIGFQSEKLKSSKKKVFYHMYISAADDTSIKDFKLAPDRNIKGIGISFDNFNNKIIITGFHSDSKSTTGAAIFYSHYDFRSDSPPDITSSPIDARQNVKLAGERNRRAGLALVNYPIERIIVRNDGGAVIISEGSYTNEYSYYDYFTQSYTRTIEYVFGNIVVISVNNDGSIDWSNVLEKLQVSVDDGGALSSFSHLLNSEEMITLFNTDISKKNKVVSAKINKFGELSRPVVLTKLDGLLLTPRSGRQVSASEIVIPVYNRKKLFLTRVTFE